MRSLLLPCYLLFASLVPAYAQWWYFGTFFEKGTPQQIEYYIYQDHIDVNLADKNGETALMVAAGNNKNPKVIDVIIIAGADPNARDNKGKTPLMYAAAYNKNEYITRELLTFGADINEKDEEGASALIWAVARNSNPEIIRILIESGADAKLKTRAGKIAFDYASENLALKDTEAFKMLERASK